jgi:hypothetical protein
MIPLFIENFLPNQVLTILNSYCILKYSNKKSFKVDTQTSSLISEHSDFLMETICDLSTPVVEQNVGKKLFPTYSFLRIYDKGSDLPIHKDRPSCEYTVALCLGADPIDEPYELFVGEVDESSDYKYFDAEGNYNRYKINYKYPMKPNNALIFKGMNNIHWREICTHDHFITVFLHYVDQQGEFKEYKYDKRSMLGET